MRPLIPDIRWDRLCAAKGGSASDAWNCETFVTTARCNHVDVELATRDNVQKICKRRVPIHAKIPRPGGEGGSGPGDTVLHRRMLPTPRRCDPFPQGCMGT